MLRAIHGSTVLYPCDANQTASSWPRWPTARASRSSARLRRETPVLYAPGEEFPIGGSRVLRLSDRTTSRSSPPGSRSTRRFEAADLAGRGGNRGARDRRLLGQADRRADAARPPGRPVADRHRRGSLARGRPRRRGASALADTDEPPRSSSSPSERCPARARRPSCSPRPASTRRTSPRRPGSSSPLGRRGPGASHGRSHRVRTPQGALRRPALPRRLVHGRSARTGRPRGPERLGQDDAAARDRRADRPSGRRARLREGHTRRTPRPASPAGASTRRSATTRSPAPTT